MTHSMLEYAYWFPSREPFFIVMFKTIPYLISLLISLNNPAITGSSDMVLSNKSISLEERYSDKFVNGVFKDNILLTLGYMDGDIKEKSEIVWSDIEKPQNFGFALKPGESFAFHDQVLPEYDQNIVKTTNAHFNYKDGFKSDGYLMGDGVCHLASLIFWAAKDAGLNAFAPTNHDFAKINEVPKEYGVSIYNLPGNFNLSARQNLYIKNIYDKPVVFLFNYNGTDLTLNIIRLNS